MRGRFLAQLSGDDLTIDELNTAFTSWLREDYHYKVHNGIDGRPIDRFHASTARVDIRRLSKPELNEIFLVRKERIVNNDATISFKGNIYSEAVPTSEASEVRCEVPAAYIRQKIEIRHPVDDPAELFLYDNGARVGRLKLVDTHENARTFQPTQETSPISFARAKVRP